MGTSIVSLFIGLFSWMAFIFGIPLNCIMIRAIVCHTPKQMRIYSKILLQTCLVDILLLIMTFLFIPCNFVTAKGETEAIVYGIVTIKGVKNRIWNALAFVCWVFLVYVSMFGYVSQFIFRYLAIVRDKKISSSKYFLLLFLILLFPFAYCVNLFICYFPSTDHAIMEDKSVAEILGINLDDQIVLAGYSFNDFQLIVGFYYVCIVCTVAFITIFILAYLIQKFLEKTKNKSSSVVAKKMIEINKEVSRNMIIQASMPLIIYFSVLFLLTLLQLKIDTKGWNWLQYYNLLSAIPMFLPSIFNPIISLYTIKYYRRVIIADMKKIEKCVKRMFQPKTSQQNLNERNQNEQLTHTVKWAIFVTKTPIQN